MHELELKFFVPTANQSALKTQMAVKDSQSHGLGAYYFDTENKALAKAGIALRIRYEGTDNTNGNWVQTLKTKGDGVAKRVELNFIMPFIGSPETIELATLRPDLTVINESSIIEQLEMILPLEQLQNSLKIQYFTDVKRQTRLIKKADTQIEVAYDNGQVQAQPLDIMNHNKGVNSASIHEVEFELLSGDPQVLVDTVKQWCKRHKLIISTVTKAERGNLLLKQQPFADPTKSDLEFLANSLNKNMSQHAFMQAVVNNCLLQILPNATAIAEGSQDGNHVHQIRVGIRRLRTALKMFKGFSTDIIASESYQRWRNVLAHTFGLLGEYRDKEILKIKTQPMLEMLGSPYVAWDTNVKVMPIDAVCANDFQLVLLELIGFTYLPDDEKSPKAKPALAKILDKLFNKIAKASSHFASLDTDSQHQVRKDLKTLRYVSEFSAPLFDSKKLDKKQGDKSSKAFTKYLEPAQDVLGEYNDNVVGHAHYVEKAKIDPNALFAVGWFGAQEKANAEKCAESLKTVKSAPKFW